MRSGREGEQQEGAEPTLPDTNSDENKNAAAVDTRNKSRFPTLSNSIVADRFDYFTFHAPL